MYLCVLRLGRVDRKRGGDGGGGGECMNVIPMSYMLFIGDVAHFSVVRSPWETYFHGRDFSPV